MKSNTTLRLEIDRRRGVFLKDDVLVSDGGGPSTYSLTPAENAAAEEVTAESDTEITASGTAPPMTS
jgi:hypothetical protein